MEEKVMAILKDVLEDNSIDASCSQANCEKWDSMAQLNIIAELESEFNIDISIEEIAVIKSFKDIIEVLRLHNVR